MKRVIITIVAAVLAAAVVTGCGAKASTSDSKTVVVGASPSPHAEILEVAKEIMAEKGYTLEIKEYTDYVQPNLALESGDLDANYFQHQLYLDQFNTENKTHLVSLAAVHYEPIGIYPGKTSSLADLPDKAQIAVPNDTTNEARALLLLEAQGLIKMKEGADLNSTKKDIAENPKNLDIIEVEAAQIPKSLQDVDVAVINGNYAIAEGLSVSKDALAVEEPNAQADKSYGNILAVKEGNEENEGLKALAEALKSEKVKEFIEGKYDGAVVSLN